MTLDELFDKYKQKKSEAENLPGQVVETDKLLNLIAEEARGYCMRAVYWSRKHSFCDKVDEDEADSIFNEVFMTSVERGLEGKTKTLSGCLYFYFTKRMLDYIRKLPRIPVPITEMVNDEETSSEDQLDGLLDKGEGHQWIHPDHNIRAREIMEHHQNLLETIPDFQKDALKLNVNGFSHQDIANFLDVPKQKVTKQKFNARQKFREVLHKEE